MEQRCGKAEVRNQPGEAVLNFGLRNISSLIRLSFIFQWLSLLFSKEVFCKLSKKIKNRLNDELGNPATASSAPFSFDVIIHEASSNPSVPLPVSVSSAVGSCR